MDSSRELTANVQGFMPIVIIHDIGWIVHSIVVAEHPYALLSDSVPGNAAA
jgi:hypothetical protein